MDKLTKNYNLWTKIEVRNACLSVEVIEEAKRRTIDSIGCALGAILSEPSAGERYFRTNILY